MNLTIEHIILHNFKGLSHENLLFNNSNVIVSGANGSGKSTIMCGWLWLMADVSENLTSNPPIFPLGAEEVNPSVEVIASVDGKQITLERRIKRTVKKSRVDGVADAVSFSSTYFVNSCEYGLRDFRKKLEDYGITEKFLTLSHPDMFLSQKKDEMRKILFGMAQAKTDYEVACMTNRAEDAAKLLKNYTFAEAEGMQKAALRKITENYGKDGELLRSKIEGLEMSKVDLDFSAFELQKNMLMEQLEKNADAQRVGNLINTELDTFRKKDMELQFELSAICQKELSEKEELERKVRQNRMDLEQKASDLDRTIKRMTNEVQIYETAIERHKGKDKELKESLKKAKAMSFNENSLVCPTCGQLYQLDKQEKLKSDFEVYKNSMIEQAETAIKENKSLATIKRAEMAELSKKLQAAINDRSELETALKQPVNALSAHMDVPNLYADEKAKLEKAISENKQAMELKKGSMPDMTALKAEETDLRGQLRDCEIQLSKIADNARIDDMIADLREQQRTYEQNKADAERILYQLSLVQKRKNDLLTESINAHFKLVKWCFWEYQKNGEPKDVIIPKVDGKALGIATNTGLEIRMKLDIIQGLQNFYKTYLPVFVDSAECLDSNSLSKIDMPCQVIFLKVSENKELCVNEKS